VRFRNVVFSENAIIRGCVNRLHGYSARDLLPSACIHLATDAHRTVQYPSCDARHFLFA
jgi:hypothetical protein